MTIRLILAAILLFFIVCVFLVHLRGKYKLRFDRQLVDHSAVFAPYNLLMYAFSRAKAKPLLDRDEFPELDVFRDHWETIRDEALALSDEGRIRASLDNDDASFASFFRQGWKRFYLTWYGEPLESAARLCPKTLELVRSVPNVKATMFAMLAPNSRLNPHRDPFAGSLRYHLGLKTPNSPDCAIFVDGQPHAWGDGKDVVFDETYVHWVENKTDQSRLIFFADVERPLKTRFMRWLNHHFSALMGKLTRSPNQAGSGERTGLINRLYARSHGQRGDGAWQRWKAGFKSRHRGVYKAGKYLAIALALWLVFAAPWPLA